MIQASGGSMFGFILVLCICIQYPSAHIIKVYGSNFQAKELEDVVGIVNSQTLEYASNSAHYTKLPFQLRSTIFTPHSSNMLKGKSKNWSCQNCIDTNPISGKVVTDKNSKAHHEAHTKKQNFPNFIPLSNAIGNDVPVPPTASIAQACNGHNNTNVDCDDVEALVEETFMDSHLYHINLTTIGSNSTINNSHKETITLNEDTDATKPSIGSNITSTTIEYIPWVVNDSIAWYAFVAGILLTIIFVFLTSSLSAWLHTLPTYAINRLEQYVLTLFQHEKYEEAITILQYTIPCLMLWRGRQHTDTSGFQHFLVKAYSHINLPDKAIALLQTILPIYLSYGEDQYVAKVYEDSGIVYRQLTQYTHALHALHQAMRIFYEECYSSSSSAVGIGMADYSNMLDVHGNHYKKQVTVSMTKKQKKKTLLMSDSLGSPIATALDTSSVILEMDDEDDDDDKEENDVNNMMNEDKSNLLETSSTASSTGSSSSSSGSSCDLCRKPSATITTTPHHHVEYNENIVYDIQDDDSDRPFDFFLSPLSDRYAHHRNLLHPHQYGGPGSVTSHGSSTGNGSVSTAGTQSTRSTTARNNHRVLPLHAAAAPVTTTTTTTVMRNLEEDFFLSQQSMTTNTTTEASETITTIATAERLTTATATIASSSTLHTSTTTANNLPSATTATAVATENEFGMKLFQDLLQISSLDIGRLCYELGNVYELLHQHYTAMLFYSHAQYIFRKVYHEQTLLSPDLIMYERNVITEGVHQDIERKIEERMQTIWVTIQQNEALLKEFIQQKKMYKLYPIMNYYTIYHIDQHPDVILPHSNKGSTHTNDDGKDRNEAEETS